MSRIPKYAAAGKENRPALSNTRNVTRTIGSLSEAEKKNLLLNHTKPMQSASVTTNPDPRVKISATIPSTSVSVVPNKKAKVEKKTATVAPKIAPYDYKARFNNLLEKHKVLKSDFRELKDKHLEVSEEYEKVKESLEGSTAERDMLKEKLFNKSVEYESLKIYHEIKTQENEELLSKANLLEDVTKILKFKSLEFDRLKMEFDDLSHRHKSLSEETEALRVLTDHLKKLSAGLEKLQLDHQDALDTNKN